MKLSKKSEYALRALLELTLAHGKTTLQRHEIAARQNIPVEFLEQILLALKRAGLLSSRRGMKGGYGLIKSPDAITLGQVIRILDGPPGTDRMRQQDRLPKMPRLSLHGPSPMSGSAHHGNRARCDCRNLGSLYTG